MTAKLPMAKDAASGGDPLGKSPAVAVGRNSGNGAPPPTLRELRAQARRDAILSAALEEFSSAGFATARLDDIAKRAGVAKGTIYLYFTDKETLFQELARSMLDPVIGHIEALAKADIPFARLADGLVDLFETQVIGSRRKDIIRLVLAEGPRFPALAEFYYREVLSRILAALRVVLQRAQERGELRHKSLVEFPQLLAAPGIVAILWNGLFGEMAPLDTRALLKAHLDILLDRGANA